MTLGMTPSWRTIKKDRRKKEEKTDPQRDRQDPVEVPPVPPAVNSDHSVPLQCKRASYTLRSDQKLLKMVRNFR